MQVILHQFLFSHFNDKARWALSFKGIDHQRETYLPGPHMRALKKLSGQTSTPVLEWDGQVIAGSGNIIDHLETVVPAPALYPEHPEQRAAALAFEKRFDEEVGPATRTVLFEALAEEGDYLTGMFGAGKSLPKRLAYRAVFPVERGMIKKGNGVNPESIEQRKAITAAALDEVASATEETGYIIGDTFTVADLTAACFFAPLANPKHPDMQRPEPIPPACRPCLNATAITLLSPGPTGCMNCIAQRRASYRAINRRSPGYSAFSCTYKAGRKSAR